MSNQSAAKWVDLGEWGKGMDEFKLPASPDLGGQTLELRLSNSAQVMKCEFHDSRSMAWGDSKSSQKRPLSPATYEAIGVAPEIYFVDVLGSSGPNTSISMVLDLNTRQATVVTATLPESGKYDFSFVNRLSQGLDLSAVRVEIQHALINPSSPDEPVTAHESTTGLVGKRIQYTYGRDRVYEHIYLNKRFYTWHCLKGAEAGLADTEYCDYFKIAPDLFLFIWREKIMPTFGLVLIDLKEMRSNGKTFGLDISSGKYINFSMGALATFLNKTQYTFEDSRS